MAESRGGTPRGERAALCARRTRKVRRLDTRLSAFRFLAFLPFLHFVARSADREATGVHRRCSLAKIGAESGEILIA